MRAAAGIMPAVFFTNETGTIEVGKLADISAWKRDFYTDLYALLDCAFVMKDGAVYETEICEDLN